MKTTLKNCLKYCCKPIYSKDSKAALLKTKGESPCVQKDHIYPS